MHILIILNFEKNKKKIAVLWLRTNFEIWRVRQMLIYAFKCLHFGWVSCKFCTYGGCFSWFAMDDFQIASHAYVVIFQTNIDLSSPSPSHNRLRNMRNVYCFSIPMSELEVSIFPDEGMLLDLVVSYTR